jgi:hypothetical protein
MLYSICAGPYHAIYQHFLVDPCALAGGVSLFPMGIPLASALETRAPSAPATRRRPWSARLVGLSLLAVLIVSWVVIVTAVVAGVSWLRSGHG